MKENNIAKRVWIGLAVFLLLFANFAIWLSSTIYNTENFQQKSLQVFKSTEVQNAIASETVDRLLSENPGLERILSTPAQSAIAGVLGSPYLEPVFNRFSAGFQKYITSGQNEVSVNLAPVENIITAVARVTGNQDEVPEFKNTEIVILEENAFPRLDRWLEPVTNFGPILGLVGLVILAVVLYQNPEKPRTLRQIGIYLAIGVFLNLMVIPFTNNLIQQNVSNTNAATVANSAFITFTSSYKAQLLNLLILSLLLTLAPFLNKEVKKRSSK